MKKIFLLLVVTITSCLAVGDVKVDGYYRKDGTYVQPHYRSDPNGTKSDNWTTKGNINPYTGEVGTRAYGSDQRTHSGNSGYREDHDSQSNGYDLPGHYGPNGEFYHNDGNIYKPYIAMEENDSEWIGRWRPDDRQTTHSTADKNIEMKDGGWTIGPIAFALLIVIGIWGAVAKLIGRAQYFLTANQSIVEADYWSSLSMTLAAAVVGWGFFEIFM